MGLKAGTLTQIDTAFIGSMADAMMNAMEHEWRYVKKTSLPTTGREDIKLMFTAIAQGIVRHLKDNQDAFQIIGADTNESVNVKTSGLLHNF